MEKLYSDIPEALENNYNFHLRFNLSQKDQTLPSIASKESQSPEEELSKLAKKGLVDRLENFIFKNK